MRHSVLLTLISFFSIQHVMAQEQPNSGTLSITSPKAETPVSYVLQLTEFRFKSSVDPKITAREIVAQFEKPKTDDSIQHIETIRMSIQSGVNNKVQFGRQVTVTTGMMTNAGKSTRITQDRSVGTVLRVSAIPQGQSVQLGIDYESSRFDGDGTEDSPPDTVTAKITSMQLFEIGKPMLVGGTSAGETSYVIVSVDR